MSETQEREFDWWYVDFCETNKRFPTLKECLDKREEIRKRSEINE